MLFQFQAESSLHIDELIKIIPTESLHSIEVTKESTTNKYDGAWHDITAFIDVPPSVSLEDLKGYIGQVYMGDRMVRTIQPLDAKDVPAETIVIHPYMPF